MHSKISGLVAAPLTPFKPDLGVNFSAVEKIARALVADGIVGVFVNGTTGEGFSLTPAERLKLAETWMQAAGSKLRVLVNVSDLCLDQSRRYARHAQKIGAHGIGTVGPFFYKLDTLAALVEYCRETAAAAPRLPFYYYHIPGMTGTPFKAANFLTMAAIEIPSLAGIKFTHEDLMDFTDAGAMDNGRYDVLFGRDEILLAGLALGARGAIGSTYNFAGPLYLEMMSLFKRGRHAEALAHQQMAVKLVQVILRYGPIPAQKAIMNFLGLDCGSVRPPLQPLDEVKTAALRQDLEAIGFMACLTALKKRRRSRS